MCYKLYALLVSHDRSTLSNLLLSDLLLSEMTEELVTLYSVVWRQMWKNWHPSMCTVFLYDSWICAFQHFPYKLGSGYLYHMPRVYGVILWSVVSLMDVSEGFWGKQLFLLFYMLPSKLWNIFKLPTLKLSNEKTDA